MSLISDKIRAKRYRLNHLMEGRLSAQRESGELFEGTAQDCSFSSLGVEFTPPSENSKHPISVGETLQDAQLTWIGGELSLGNVMIRSIRSGSPSSIAGLVLLDRKLPLDGALSKALQLSNEVEFNPYSFELSPEKFNIGTFEQLQNESIDLFSRCQQYSVFFSEWESNSRFKYKMVREESQGPRVWLRSSKAHPRKNYLVMCSNDYLGLSSHPKVCEEVIRVTRSYGFGSTGSPLSSGTTDIHEELKDLIARTFRKEKALLFNSGYAANVGGIPALVSEKDLIVADVLSHQSIQDGIRLANAEKKLFKHNSMSHLERVLKNSRSQFAGTLLVTEGIFSMDGDGPDLRTFVNLAKDYRARTFLDEAHSFGVIGPRGLGAAFKYDIVNEIDILMGTFSKICGGIGGFLAGPKIVMDWYFWLAKSHAFSVSLPPSTAAAMLTALKIFLSTPELPEKLQSNIRYFVKGLQGLGCPIGDSHEGAVIPVIIGDLEKIKVMSQVIYDHGVYTLPIEYPAVNRRGARFRFTIMANHTESDLDQALSAIQDAMRKANFSFSEVFKQYQHLSTSNTQEEPAGGG